LGWTNASSNAAPAIPVNKSAGPYNFNLYVHQWPTRWREREAQQPLCQWIREGKLKASEFVTHEFALEDWEEAFEAVESLSALKAVLVP
jgi:threonine dehydrogenase-like Zn-dependent dehydrogenase